MGKTRKTKKKMGRVQKEYNMITVLTLQLKYKL